MSSTNKTTNYELSQFLGTDKPAWLSDYNTDMSKIDTQMKANADGVAAVSGSASAATTAIGTLANLNTEVKTDLVSSINEVVSDVTTAQNTANAASTAANTANTNVAKFNLSNVSAQTVTANKGTVDGVTNVRFATDTTSSVFKIYGRINLLNLRGQTGTLTVNLGQTSLRPSAAYTISCAAIVYRLFASGVSDTVPRDLQVNTDGTITLTDTTSLNSGMDSLVFMIPPCLYFNTDFGDN